MTSQIGDVAAVAERLQQLERRHARLYAVRYRRYVDLLNKLNEWSE